MSRTEFWEVIRESNERAGNVHEFRISALRELLGKFSKEDVKSAYRWAMMFHHNAYRENLARLFSEFVGGSDDAFSDFRENLILLGEDVYQRALADPNSLRKLDACSPDVFHWETPLNVFYDILDESELPIVPPHPTHYLEPGEIHGELDPKALAEN
jgi:hypothetical protein